MGCYVLASIGFAGSNSLYDALLIDVTSADRFHQVSALGFGLGYLGGSVLFILNVWMVSSPGTFGLGSELEAIRLAFLLVRHLVGRVFAAAAVLGAREHGPG